MPAQRTPFSQILNFRSLPRRFQLLFAVLAFLITSVVLFGAPTRDTIPTIEDLKHPKIPNQFNPLSPATHKPPPEQANSTRGDYSWFSDWQWHNPFSKAITLDENRAVLPPLDTRHPVYTFYDEDKKKDDQILRAENDLLLIWRRAWWAQGFRPVVLGRGEAMENPLYDALQRMGLQPELEHEMAKLLAWATMGTGILTNWLALPMAPYDHRELAFLRRGEYPPDRVTRLDKLQNAVMYGERQAIKTLVEQIIRTAKKDAKSIMDVLKEGDIKVEKSGESIAYYDRQTINKNYKHVNNAENNPDLAKLVLILNAHLHLTWQNTFSDGIAVLKPLPTHTSALVENAVDIARNLTQCPLTFRPESCPPNRPRCKPCSSDRTIKYTAQYQNNSKLYTIGTVPHPYTLTSLHYQQEEVTAKFLRREATARNIWIMAITGGLFPVQAGEEVRVVRFKEAVAGYHGAHHSLWLTAERESQTDLEWIFGFKVPTTPPFNGDRPAPPESTTTLPSEDELDNERRLLQKARDAIKSKVRDLVERRTMVEDWSLYDTEAWRFSRAYSARRKVEREVWEQEEARFAGAERRKQGWGVSMGRWFDRDKNKGEEGETTAPGFEESSKKGGEEKDKGEQKGEGQGRWHD